MDMSVQLSVGEVRPRKHQGIGGANEYIRPTWSLICLPHCEALLTKSLGTGCLPALDLRTADENMKTEQGCVPDAAAHRLIATWLQVIHQCSKPYLPVDLLQDAIIEVIGLV
jgi:hypothetical protein